MPGGDAVVERHRVAPAPCPGEGGCFGRAAGYVGRRAGSRAAWRREELGRGWPGLAQRLSACTPGAAAPG